jgi:hypothetical protein
MQPTTRGLVPIRLESPPLPEVPASSPRQAAPRTTLADGSYLINYTPAGVALLTYDGTMRVEATPNGAIASGDLYQRNTVIVAPPPDPDSVLEPEPVEVLEPPPDPAAGIPILPLDRYRQYLKVTKLAESADGFSLVFQNFRYGSVEAILLDGSRTAWLRENTLSVQMKRDNAPEGYPRPDLYFSGDVRNEAGTVVGRLTMGFVSSYFRKATVEIDRVTDAPPLVGNGVGDTWESIFSGMGWELTVVQNQQNVQEPSGEGWNKAEAHEAMRALRDRSDLNVEWRYHILAVRQIEFAGGERGVMYDDNGGGANNLPREGLMVSSHWQIPDESAWGVTRGKRFGETVAYFRTAVHELGHALGLEHNTLDTHFMRDTLSIVADSQKPSSPPFPDNITWAFSDDDQRRLRHWPDQVIRPGGMNATWRDRIPLNPFEAKPLKFEVTPLLASVPLGAPVRIDVSLTNIGDGRIAGPRDLSLSSGPVRGQVVDAGGTVRMFAPLVIDENTHATRILLPGQRMTASMTLFGGREGALFPAPGVYRVLVEASWVSLGLEFVVVGETRITVTPPADGAHGEAARRLFAAPETLLTLAFGGDHLGDGIAAVAAALNGAVLRPHFAYVEAKRLATRFGKREPDLAAAAALIDATTVMSPDEFRRVVRIVSDNAGSSGAQALAQSLKKRVAAGGGSDEIKALVEAL